MKILKIIENIIRLAIRYYRRKMIFPKAKKNPKWITDKKYYRVFGTKIDYENPKNINEKIHWLKFHSDTSLWSILADKIEVRRYVEDKWLRSILNEVYEIYNSVNDIDISNLPDSFVMKTNNGCWDTLIVNNKSNFSNQWIKKYFRKKNKDEHWVILWEYHYRKIKPLIFAEKLLIESDKKWLTDYKFYCYDWKVKYVTVIYERTEKWFTMCTYDMDWNHLKNIDIQSKYIILGRGIKKPESFKLMVEICRKLSEGIPFVRIDLYDIDNKPLFGEMTFTPSGGFLKCYTTDFLDELWKLIQLPGNEDICSHDKV